MGNQIRSGFTIIETMLVLAISGILVAGLLFGIGNSINAQRYRDSVTSFKSYIQDQYAQLDSVQNGRTDAQTCSGVTGVPMNESDASAVSRGQSNCVLIGRYIVINGNRATAATVLGSGTVSSAAVNEIAAIQTGYRFGIDKTSIIDDTLEWGARLSWPLDGEVPDEKKVDDSARGIRMLLIRSPVSGTTYTFTVDGTTSPAAVSSTSMKSMMTSTTQNGRVLCVAPNGFAVPERLSVMIAAFASGSNAIQSSNNQALRDEFGAEASQC